jgi:hypothetical protein
VYFAAIPPAHIRPFDPDYDPGRVPIGEAAITETMSRWRQGQFSKAWVYQKGDSFILSDDYIIWEAVKRGQPDFVPCWVIGKPTIPEVVDVQGPIRVQDIRQLLGLSGSKPDSDAFPADPTRRNDTIPNGPTADNSPVRLHDESPVHAASMAAQPPAQRPFPYWSTLGLLVPVLGFAQIHGTPAPPLTQCGYVISSLGYAVLFGGFIGGSFGILRLHRRAPTIIAGAVLLLIGTLLVNLGLVRAT